MGKTSWAIVGVGVLACAPLLWWIETQLPITDVIVARPDYLIHPVALSDGAQASIGFTAFALFALAATTFLRAIVGRAISRSWIGVVVAAAAWFGYVGLVYGFATEPVAGANIGAGLGIMGGVPITLAAVALIAIYGWRLRRHTGQP
jgi:hypothetical protein